MKRGHAKDNFHFWEDQIKKTDHLLFGGDDERRITSKSIIMYIEILDRQKDILKSGWSSYEDVDTAHGFLQYVFIPTAYYTWIERQSEGLWIPLSPFDVLKYEVLKGFDGLEDRAMLESDKMERAYEVLSDIWGTSQEEKQIKLEKFCDDFNKMWNREPDQKIYVRIFKKPVEVYKHICWGEFEEVIEEEISMPIEDFRFICESAYDQPFINKNLIKILNNIIPLWF
ncbi:hypothetical protein [Tindallia californiensis]|uniref:Uncharacterized protein n=1 Tax=Tindallia californiensis TaxID=159292 RepID=A0A1H3JX29_9FIRM|nr:hypothetical protein [Tindallia californiensis]SDY44441.1 hypothetical protein SAMN05192546_102142 [Tindallia californiensis]